MIQANELRIGNIISRGGYEVKVGWGTLKAISEGDDVGEPIALTEDILLKYGFERSYSYKYLFFKGEFRYNVGLGIITLLRHCERAGESQPNHCGFPFLTDQIKIQYLHQLQNLYFALTGKEIEVVS